MNIQLEYPVTLEPDTNGSVLVSFVDVPEAHTCGNDKTEALLRAVDALETALEFYVDAGHDLPRASRPRRGQHTVRPSAQACIKLSIYQAMHDDGGHSVVWPGELDVGADRLWELSLQQNGHADTAEFLRWRWRHGLSLSAAAAALGVSRRMVAYYASGEREVPRTVLLACKGWEVERRRAA